MSLKRRQHTKEFKQQVLRELEGGLPIAQVAREHALAPKLIQRWQQEYTEYGEEAFGGNGRSYKDRRVSPNWSAPSDARPWKSSICNAF